MGRFWVRGLPLTRLMPVRKDWSKILIMFRLSGMQDGFDDRDKKVVYWQKWIGWAEKRITYS